MSFFTLNYLSNYLHRFLGAPTIVQTHNDIAFHLRIKKKIFKKHSKRSIASIYSCLHVIRYSKPGRKTEKVNWVFRYPIYQHYNLSVSFCGRLLITHFNLKKKSKLSKLITYALAFLFVCCLFQCQKLFLDMTILRCLSNISEIFAETWEQSVRLKH